jgi:hypothetical protein
MRFCTTMGLAAVLVLTTGGVSPAAGAQSGFETEPVLKASDLVAAELRKGPNFTVDDRVPVKGFLARFTIRSGHGVFEAHGIHMLQVRIKEIIALNQLDEMSKTKEFAAAAGRAIARPVTSTVNIVTHPVETVKGLPDGVSRLWDRVELGAQAIAGAASAPDKTEAEKAADVSQRVGSVTVTALGYEKERRDLAKGLSVDPYTTNAVLAKKLDDMAWVAFSGRFGIQAATSIFVPYSMAMSAVTITNTAVYDTPQGDLVNRAKATFAGTGASEAQVGALMRNAQYSLSVLTALAHGLQRLQGVKGLPSVVQFAAAAKTQDETRFVAASANILARYHESVAPITQVTAPGPIIGRTAGGTVMVPAPLDYVAWTERVARFAAREDLKGPERVAWLSGRLSQRALKEFDSRRWKIHESFTIGAER